jgi:hypothetical protein
MATSSTQQPSPAPAHQRAPAAGRLGDRLATLAVALAAVAAAAWIFRLTRGLTFYNDEWEFVAQRGSGLSAALEPHNQHIVLVPYLLYEALFRVAGLAHYWPYRVMIIAVHVGIAVALFAYARRRTGPVLAVIPPLILLFLGPAWEDILWPFQIGFLLPLLASLGALLALDRGDAPGDAVASSLLVIGVLSGSLAVCVSIGIAAELALGHQPLRRLARVLAAPTVVYGAWYLMHRDDIAHYRALRKLAGFHDLPLTAIPHYVARALGQATGVMFSVPAAFGGAAVLVLGLLGLARIARDPRGSGRLIGLAVSTLAYWTLTAIYRSENGIPPSRYIYVGTVFILLLAIEAARGIRVVPEAVAVACALATLVVVSNVSEMRAGADRLHRFTDFVRPGLAAVDLAGSRADPTFTPLPAFAPWVTVRGYRRAVAAYGSPAMTPEQVAATDVDARRNADAILVRAIRPTLSRMARPARSGPPPVVSALLGERVTTARGCDVLTPQAATGVAELRAPPAGLVLRAAKGAPVAVRLRRFAPDYAAPRPTGLARLFTLYGEFAGPTTLTVPGGSARALRLGRDRLARPWYVRLVATRPILACTAARG